MKQFKQLFGALFLLLTLGNTAVQAQSLEYLVVVNGGKFGFNPAPTDYANIGIKDLSTGNYYAPWGHVGPYTNNFRIFDATTMTYVDTFLKSLSQQKTLWW